MFMVNRNGIVVSGRVSHGSKMTHHRAIGIIGSLTWEDGFRVKKSKLDGGSD